MVEKENPVQVINLVLEDNGKAVFGCQFSGLSAQILVGDSDLFVPFDIGGQVNDTETAFLVDLGSFMTNKAGVDHGQDLLFFFDLGYINHNQLNGLANLGRGQTNAGRVIHGLGHIPDQFDEPFVKNGDRLCLLTEDRVWKF